MDDGLERCPECHRPFPLPRCAACGGAMINGTITDVGDSGGGERWVHSRCAGKWQAVKGLVADRDAAWAALKVAEERLKAAWG